MSGTLQPLDQKFAIVDAQGQPTDYFIRWAQQKQIDIGDSITLQNLKDYLTAHTLIAGTGIQLTPDGNINDIPTIHADAQAILDEITATRGAVLYRGLLGWAGLAPGTAGQFLKTNGAGADPAWAAASGSGGGSTPTIRGSSLVQASTGLSATVAWPAGTIAGDLAIVFVGSGFDSGVTPPVGWGGIGWTMQQANWNGMIYSKILTAADITAGSVTINFTGNFALGVTCVTFVGSTVTNITWFNYMTQTALSRTTFNNIAAAAKPTDRLLLFSTGRVAGVWTAGTGGTALQTFNQAVGPGSGIVADFGAANAVATRVLQSVAPAAVTAWYSAVIGIGGP